MLVAYASGHAEVKELVNGVLAKLKAPPTALFSTLGRIAARAIETQLIARQVPKWIDELDSYLSHGELRIHNGENGTRPRGRSRPSGGVSTKRPADHRGTGSRSKTGRSRTTSALFPPRGTRAPATHEESAEPTRRRY